eukprot:c51677_g1_i1 orf=148-573(-)
MGAFLSQQVRRICQVHKSVRKVAILDHISEPDTGNETLEAQSCIVCSCGGDNVPCQLKPLQSQYLEFSRVPQRFATVPLQIKGQDVFKNAICESNIRGRILESDEIDIRADEFIARFHEQIRLERKASEKRYLEMLERGVS